MGWGRRGMALTMSGALLGGALVFAPQSVSAAPPPAVAPQAQCPTGAPGLAVKVSWQTVDTFFLAMDTHITVANCRSKIRYVRIVWNSLKSAGTGLVEQDAEIRSTLPAKNGNRRYLINARKYLRALYTEAATNSGPIKGIALDDKKSLNNLMNCQLLMDKTPINTADYSFTIRVEPLDSRLRVIPTVGAASLGPFACGQPIGTT